MKGKPKLSDLKFDGEVAFERLRRFGRIVLAVRKDPAPTATSIKPPKKRGNKPDSVNRL